MDGFFSLLAFGSGKLSVEDGLAGFPDSTCDCVDAFVARRFVCCPEDERSGLPNGETSAEE